MKFKGVRSVTMRAFAALATFALATPFLGAQESGIAVGMAAPPAAVETLDGRPADLKDLIGTRPLVIEFWATWCANCRELPFGDAVPIIAPGSPAEVCNRLSGDIWVPLACPS